MREVGSGTFQSMVRNLLRRTTNNHGFEVTWDLDVTVEGVPEEASGDDTHAQIFTNDEDTVRQYPVEE